MKKDTISKDIVETLIKDIAKYILNIEISKLEFIDKEFERIESRRADVVVKVDNSYILHLEIQNSNDKTMPIRMLRYLSDIKLKTTLPVKQYLIYIGKDKLKMSAFIKDENLDYKYNLIDMKQIDCETFIKLDTPDALVLAILCDFKGKNPQNLINYIIKRLYDLTKDNEKAFRRYMIMLEELSTNRDLKDMIKEGEQMLSEIKYEELPSYEIGFEEGEFIGEKRGEKRGKKIGEKIGEIKGEIKGELKAKKMIISNLLKKGMDIKTIANLIEISEEEIKKIKDEYVIF